MKFKGLVLFTLTAVAVNATSLRHSIEDTLNNNPSIIASELNKEAFLQYIEEGRGDYFPTINLDAYYENSKTKRDTSDDTIEIEGYNTALRIEYILYNGGLRGAKSQESINKYNANRFKNIYEIENTIYDTVETYIDLLSNQEQMALTQDNIKVHENYLGVAKMKEEISGEILETHQVKSKYHYLLDKHLKQLQEQNSAKTKYKKLVGQELNTNICRPNIDTSFIPKTLKEAIEVGLKRSFKINEQIEKIKQQSQKVAIERAGFAPTVTVELKREWDNDISLENNGKENTYSGKVNLTWNLFNGGKTYAATGREQLFLKEEQKKLDAITAEVIEDISVAYFNYFNAVKKVDNLKKHVEDNHNILKIYTYQLEDGTRKFIDILNAEIDLYRSDIDLITQQMELYKAYYTFLNKSSILSDSLVAQPSQVCKKYSYSARERVKLKTTNVEINLEDFLEEKPNELLIKELQESQKEVKSKLKKIYNTDFHKEKK